MPRNLNPVGYNGNPLLPLPNAQIQLTAEELAEYIKCSENPSYFINNYVRIVHVDYGIIKFSMWPFQEKLVETFEKNRFVICKLARQTGKSTVVVCGYFLWFILFHADVSVGILANKEATAIQLLDRLKQSFELLPDFLKQGVVKWDAKLVKLANNARVRAEATSASAIRGDTFNLLFLDEFAFVPENIALDFMTSVFPSISSGKTTKLFIVSTPNGYNLFYKLWNDALEGRNSYTAIGFTWRDVPGRDEAWAEEQRRNMGSEQKFAQEYECDFMGSANTLVAPWKLAQIGYRAPLQERGHLKIYTKPVYMTEEGAAHVYLVVVDVAEGQEKDFSVAQVIDISESPFKQVAVWRDNKTKPAQFAPVIADLARYYNQAFCFLEINGEGQTVADMLVTELEYENVIQIFPHQKKGQTLSSGFNPRARLGLKTSEPSKKIGCTGLKSLVENDKLLLVDYDTIRELTTFVAQISKSNGKTKTYSAEVGNHDDCVSPLVLLGWLTMQSGFENYVGLSMRQLLMDGHPPLTFDEGFVGFLGDREQTPVVGQTARGFDIIEDTDFWRGDTSSGSNDDKWLK